jgi:hypothetical protein
MWYFSNVFKCIPFFSFCYNVHYACYNAICMSHVQYVIWSFGVAIITSNCLYMIFISSMKCSVLCISIGSLGIWFGICPLFLIYLSVSMVFLYFVLLLCSGCCFYWRFFNELCNPFRFFPSVCEGSSFFLLVLWVSVFVLCMFGGVFPDSIYVVFIVVWCFLLHIILFLCCYHNLICL